MTKAQPDRSDARGNGVALRLLWPQWQGAGTASIQALAPEFPFQVARRGYAVGSAVLAAVLPANQGPTAAAPVAMDDAGLELADGIEAKQVILTQPGCSTAVWPSRCQGPRNHWPQPSIGQPHFAQG